MDHKGLHAYEVRPVENTKTYRVDLRKLAEAMGLPAGAYKFHVRLGGCKFSDGSDPAYLDLTAYYLS